MTRSAPASDGAARAGGGLFAHLGKLGSGAVLEAPGLVAGLDDLAVMGETIEERRRHLRITEHARPLAESEVGGDDDRGALIEPADQMEQQLPAGLGEGQISQFVEDNEVEADEIVGQTSLTAAAGLAFQPVDQVDHGVEPAPGSAADAGPGDGDGEMALAGAGAADEDGVALLGKEGAGCQFAYQGLVDRRAVEAEVVDILGQRQLGNGQLVDGPRTGLCMCLYAIGVKNLDNCESYLQAIAPPWFVQSPPFDSGKVRAIAPP